MHVTGNVIGHIEMLAWVCSGKELSEAERAVYLPHACVHKL